MTLHCSELSLPITSCEYVQIEWSCNFFLVVLTDTTLFFVVFKLAGNKRDSFAIYEVVSDVENLFDLSQFSFNKGLYSRMSRYEGAYYAFDRLLLNEKEEDSHHFINVTSGAIFKSNLGYVFLAAVLSKGHQLRLYSYINNTPSAFYVANLTSLWADFVQNDSSHICCMNKNFLNHIKQETSELGYLEYKQTIYGILCSQSVWITFIRSEFEESDICNNNSNAILLYFCLNGVLLLFNVSNLQEKRLEKSLTCELVAYSNTSIFYTCVSYIQKLGEEVVLAFAGNSKGRVVAILLHLSQLKCSEVDLKERGDRSKICEHLICSEDDVCVKAFSCHVEEETLINNEIKSKVVLCVSKMFTYFVYRLELSDQEIDLVETRWIIGHHIQSITQILATNGEGIDFLCVSNNADLFTLNYSSLKLKVFPAFKDELDSSELCHDVCLSRDGLAGFKVCKDFNVKGMDFLKFSFFTPGSLYSIINSIFLNREIFEDIHLYFLLVQHVEKKADMIAPYLIENDYFNRENGVFDLTKLYKIYNLWRIIKKSGKKFDAERSLIFKQIFLEFMDYRFFQFLKEIAVKFYKHNILSCIVHQIKTFITHKKEDYHRSYKFLSQDSELKVSPSSQLITEVCVICREEIPFTDALTASCKNEHLFERCSISFTSCFDVAKTSRCSFCRSVVNWNVLKLLSKESNILCPFCHANFHKSHISNRTPNIS